MPQVEDSRHLAATGTHLYRRYFRLTALNILANVTVPLAGLVDTAILGHLAEIRYLAGVALASLLFDYVYWTFGFLRMGTTGTTAQAVGRGDERDAYLILYRSILLALGVSLALLALQWPIRSLGFALLSGTPQVELAGQAYFNARIWGAPAALCSFAFIGWYLGREESRYVLAMTVAANLTNVVLDYVLIVQMGLAAAGAGLATMVSQYVGLAVALWIFLRLRRPRRWRWSEVLDRDGLAALVTLNRDILVRTLSLITTFALFTDLSSILGTVTLAANAILLRVLSLASYFIDGAAFATESLAGIFRGERNLLGLRRLVRLSLIFGEACALLFIAALVLRPVAVYRVLTSHGEVLAAALQYGRWLVPVLLFGSIAYIYDGLFLGLTEGRVLRRSMLFSTVFVFIPVAWLAVRTESNHLLWLAMVLFMVARAATLGLATPGVMRTDEGALRDTRDPLG
jgi:MATE family multidrug resistance protein